MVTYMSPLGGIACTSLTSMLAASCNSGDKAASLVLYVENIAIKLVTTCYILH